MKAMPVVLAVLLFAQEGRPFGVSVTPVCSPMAAQLDLPPGEGVVVDEVLLASVADKAGVRRYDILLRVDGKVIRSAEGFRIQIREALKKAFELEVMRRGRRETLQVRPD